MEATTRKDPRIRTACDICYRLKEKCERATLTARCARCRRLSLSCSTVRPVKPVGRRIQREACRVFGPAPTDHGNNPRQGRSVVGAIASFIADQIPEERELLLFLLGNPESLDQYVVCPSFQSQQQQFLAALLPLALPSLKDAYLACAVTLKQLQQGGATNADANTSISYILKAMSALRSLPVLRTEDAVLCHTLGGALVFSIHAAIGAGVPEICRYCLETTSQFADTAATGAEEDPWRNLLVLQDTMNCIVHRQVPIGRFRVPATLTVDRHLGLCLPLMSYYQDICVISSALRDTTDKGTLDRTQKQLDDIHTAVESWQPSCIDQLLIAQFDSAEVVNLLAQAKIYRLGALLLGHRLRYPFGQGDVQAQIWSRELLMELELAKRVTNRPMRFVTLPFLLAALEVQDASLRTKTLQRVDEWVDQYSPIVQNAAKAFLLRVWHERDTKITSYWFDSMVKPCPVLSSLNADCFGPNGTFLRTPSTRD